MVFPLLAAFTQTLFMLLLGGMALFLILLVLVQKGRGGGLAGALGGMGGSSAFGAKAGDVFTKITIGTATIWIVLCIAAAKLTPSNESRVDLGTAGTTTQQPSGPALTGPPSTDSEGAAAEEGQETATDDQSAAETEESSSEPPAETSEAEPAADEAAASDEEGN